MFGSLDDSIQLEIALGTGARPSERWRLIATPDGPDEAALRMPALIEGTMMSRVPVKPYLITKDESGQFRLTVRRTWYNSQNYPLIDSKLQDEVFASMTEARAFAREHFGAEAGQYARA